MRRFSWRIAPCYFALTLTLAYPSASIRLAPRRRPFPTPTCHMRTLAWKAHAFTHQRLSIFDANIYDTQARTLASSENLIGGSLFAEGSCG